MAGQERGSSHRVRDQLRRVLNRTVDEVVQTDAAEPCASCGEETAVGSVLYSDRHDLALAEGGRAHLCAECYQRARAAKGGELTDADAEAIASNGFLIGVHMLTGH